MTWGYAPERAEPEGEQVDGRRRRECSGLTASLCQPSRVEGLSIVQ